MQVYTFTFIFCSFHSFMRLKKWATVCNGFHERHQHKQTTFTGDSTFRTPLFQGWFWCHNSQRTFGDPKKNAAWLHYIKNTLISYPTVIISFPCCSLVYFLCHLDAIRNAHIIHAKNLRESIFFVFYSCGKRSFEFFSSKKIQRKS